MRAHFVRLLAQAPLDEKKLKKKKIEENLFP